jgi:hypothetical protein
VLDAAARQPPGWIRPVREDRTYALRMPASASDADLAFTYAWWLTGDPGAAESAVREAAAQVGDDGPADGRRIALLEAVRAGAIRERTMCPASELAILHDAQGLDLPDAARLARIDPADARVELAHGRLEALLETVREPFAHPERLGGLAVGNPPDVAHSRQCDSCADVLRLLATGRDALRDIPPPPTPTELIALIGGEAPPSVEPVEPLASEPVQPPHAEVAEPPTAEPPTAEPAESAEPPAGEADADTTQKVISFVDDALEEPYVEPEPLPVPDEPARRRLLLPAVIVLALALLAITLFANLRPGGGSDEVTDVTIPSADAPQEAPDAGAPAPEGFAIDGVGMIRRGQFVPAGPGIVLTTTDRVRIAVRYSGATDGVVVAGRWNVEGKPFRELRVALSSRRSMHVFTAALPAGGWPPGLHHVVLTVGDTVVATVDFRVV